MKRIIIISLILFICYSVQAASINPVAYRQMQLQQYQRTRAQQQQNKQIPYWQAQSNYSTRNRIYNNNYNYSQSSQYSNYYRREY